MAPTTMAQPKLSADASAYIDVLRFSAAVLVFLFHAPTPVFGPWLWQLRGYGHPAVIVFFVMSGFVIAYTCDAGKHLGFADYIQARLARLYSVAIPAILFTVLADELAAKINFHAYQAFLLSMRVSTAGLATSVAAAATFTNELWAIHIPLLDNIPYWSIGYEFWYYVLFGIAFYWDGRRRIVGCALVALIMGPKILTYLPIWLSGCLAYWAIPLFGNKRLAGALLAFLSIAALFAIQFWGIHSWSEVTATTDWRYMPYLPLGFTWFAFVEGALIAVNILGMSVMLRNSMKKSSVHRTIAYIAGSTFTLYLFHFPIIIILRVLTAGMSPSPWSALLMYLLVFCAVFLIAQFTERRKAWWKSWLARIWNGFQAHFQRTPAALDL